MLVNEAAISEMVDELLDDAEINLVYVPDVIEAATYRHVFKMMVQITEEMLRGIKMNVFGVEVRFSIVNPAISKPSVVRGHTYYSEADVRVSLTALQEKLKDVAEEHRLLEQLVNQAMLGKPAESKASDLHTHDFHALAQQDRLARSLRLSESVNVDISIPYEMIQEFETYKQWMPLATNGRVLSRGDVEEVRNEGSTRLRKHLKAEVGFGLDTQSFLGTIGAEILYDVQLEAPTLCADGSTAARVYADAKKFTYGERLIWDWSFRMPPGEERTEVQLDFFIQASSVLYLPLWDSLLRTVMTSMMKSFFDRAHALQKSKFEMLDKNQEVKEKSGQEGV